MRNDTDRRFARLLRGAAATRIALVVAVAVTGAACTQAGASADGDEVPMPDLEPGAERADGVDDIPASTLRLGGEPDMDQFLTAVLGDVEAYWTSSFEGVGLPAPSVSHDWTEEGEQAVLGCVDEEGETVVTDDSTALYCPIEDRIVISQQFARDLRDGLLVGADGQVADPAPGDFGVAFVVAHEYAHNLQSELFLDRFPLGTEATELHADCWAGVWAASAYDADLLDDGDIEEAIATASLFGDHDVDHPAHHGTPTQRVVAFSAGFASGHPLACTPFLAGGLIGS